MWVCIEIFTNVQIQEFIITHNLLNRWEPNIYIVFFINERLNTFSNPFLGSRYNSIFMWAQDQAHSFCKFKIKPITIVLQG